MSFLSTLFKRKPGGTRVGNLIRSVVDNFTLGLYSAINPAPPSGGHSGAYTANGYDGGSAIHSDQ